jgi:hypothetical protein
MRSSFKDFARSVFTFPARVFSGLVGLVVGDNKRDANGAVVGQTRGLLGLIADGIKSVGRAITDFVKAHQKAISTAFWLSLAIGGAAALTVALWPAALAAVTGFAVYGVSIASVVGANFVAQVLATAAVAFAATSLAVYAAATVSNLFTAVKGLFAKKAATVSATGENTEEFGSDSDNDNDNDDDDFTATATAKSMSQLSTAPASFVASSSSSVPPVFHNSPLALVPQPTVQVVEENHQNTNAM